MDEPDKDQERLDACWREAGERIAKTMIEGFRAMGYDPDKLFPPEEDKNQDE